MARYYFTTPLYYVNDIPHVGHAYSTVMTDIFSRYHRLFGDDTWFLTGTDEHGQKVEKAASDRGLDPQVHCDQMMENFKKTWSDFTISHDVFFTTTAKDHVRVVQDVLKKIFDKGDIYSDTYTGWYCEADEIFYTDKDIVDGKSPTGRDVVKIEEKNYFFKMSKYAQELVRHIENNPEFIRPKSRRNEILGFLKKGLGDLCISRPKSRLKWGIEIPFDTNYVTYVWFDALLNYANGVGFMQAGREAEFQKWWQQADVVHVLGKDILTTHAVYWTTMLLALGQKLPKTIFAHGWILNKDNQKMSKSQGDVINPMNFKDIVGVDGIRYFFARDIVFGNDAPISRELVYNRLNAELANNLGNLFSRASNLILKYFNGQVVREWPDDMDTNSLIAVAKAAAAKVKDDVNDFKTAQALETIVQLLNAANKYLEDKAPWTVAKTDVALAGRYLYVALEIVRIAGGLLTPVMPSKCAELYRRLSIGHVLWKDLNEFGVIVAGQVIERATHFFHA